jgi:hypothetical protein
MIIASFNVESLFERAQALDKQDWATGAPALEQHAEINRLLGEPIYTDAIKKRIVDLLVKLGLDKSDEGRGCARLRVNRGHLLTRSAGEVTIVAAGRVDWIGWVELKMEPVNELATQHTAQVLKDIDADVQVVVEAESRISLETPERGHARGKTTVGRSRTDARELLGKHRSRMRAARARFK